MFPELKAKIEEAKARLEAQLVSRSCARVVFVVQGSFRG